MLFFRNHWGMMLLLLVVAFVLASCPAAGPFSFSDGDDEAGEPIRVETTLFEENETTGEIEVKTNDVTNLGSRGKSLWHMGTTNHSPLAEITVRLYKLSGRSEMGYGITFAMRDIDNFLTVMITTTGSYIIGRVEDRVFTALTEDELWQYSSDLTQGYNRPNRITVTYNGTDDQFSLSINGEHQQTFVDSSDDPLTGGYFGHIVTLSPLETFPELPVHMVFESETPVDIGVVPYVGEGASPQVRGIYSGLNRAFLDSAFGY